MEDRDDITAGSPLRFLLRWTPGRPLSLLTLDWRRGRGEWTAVLGSPRHGDDGSMVVDLGPLDPGPLTLRFVAGGWGEIPRAAAFLVGPGERTVRIAPDDRDGFRRIRAGDLWRTSAKVVVEREAVA